MEQFSEFDWNKESTLVTLLQLLELFTSLSSFSKSGSETGVIGVIGVSCGSTVGFGAKFPLLTSSIALRS